MALSEGSKIGNVRLLERLSEGGMGSIWLAHHLTLNVRVVVKFITEALTDDPLSVARFQQEAQLAAQIKSPHVVNVLDHGLTDDGVPYITMELLEGETLDERLDEGPLTLDEATTFVKQMGMALRKAHGRGVVHRDLKPGNVYLVESDYDIFIKILDFGIAKNARRNLAKLTATASVVGTASYMSPEQLVSTKNVDGRADLWALAVLLFESLTCWMPFDGETVTSVGVEICTRPHVPLLEARPELPGALEGFFSKAFDKKLERRHADIDEFVEDFCKRAAVAKSSAPSKATPERRTVPLGSAAARESLGRGEKGAPVLGDGQTVRIGSLPPPKTAKIVQPVAATLVISELERQSDHESAAPTPVPLVRSRLPVAAAVVVALAVSLFFWRRHASDETAIKDVVDATAAHGAPDASGGPADAHSAPLLPVGEPAPRVVTVRPPQGATPPPSQPPRPPTKTTRPAPCRPKMKRVGDKLIYVRDCK